MRSNKIAAIHLRRSGKSYREIEKTLGIAKSTLSGWFKKTPWSHKVKERLSQIARRQSSQRMKALIKKINRERKKVYRAARTAAENQFPSLKKFPLFIAGLMIYWGEGDRNLKNGMIRVSNTDPALLKLFYLFLQKYLPEITHRIRAYLVLYPDLNEENCKNFWSKNIEIPVDKFYKSTYIHGRHRTKKLGYGICTITVNNRAYKEKIYAWLNLIRGEVVNMRV